MKHRLWSVEQKMAIVLEGIREKKAVAEICREHEISQTQYYKWRDRFLNGAQKELSGNCAEGSENFYKSELKSLQNIIGKQAIQIEILKKTEEILGRKSGR